MNHDGGTPPTQFEGYAGSHGSAGAIDNRRLSSKIAHPPALLSGMQDVAAQRSPAAFSARVSSKIGALHGLVLQKSLAVLAENDPPRLQNIAGVGDLKRHESVLLDEQNSDAAAPDLLDRIEDLIDEDGSETHARLIEKKETRFG
jgi:hypothetical protein